MAARVNDRAKYAEKLTWLESLEVQSPQELRGRRLATRVWAGAWPVLLAILSCSRYGS